MYHFSPAEHTFLESQRVGRMAQVGEDGLPHSIPLCYASTDSAVYIETSGRSWKVRSLIRLPDVAFVADEYFEDWAKLRGIRMQGKADVLEKGDEYETGKRLLFQKYPEQFEKMGWADGVNVVLKITPTKVNAWGL